MPQHLFRDVMSPSVSMGNRMRYTVPLTMVLQGLMVAALVMAPLMAIGGLPSLSSSLTMVSVAPPPAPPPPPPAPSAEVPPPASTPSADPNAAPIEAPSDVRPERSIEDAPTDSHALPGAGSIAGDPTLIVGDPPPPPAPAPGPVRVGGQVQPPTKVLHVNPVYPPIAQTAGVQGLVIIEATIDADGRDTDTRVLRSIPLLDPAALAAVQQWRFAPTRLNGLPVPVVMTVTVQFSLR